jgi:hypothetical protein
MNGPNIRAEFERSLFYVTLLGRRAAARAGSDALASESAGAAAAPVRILNRARSSLRLPSRSRKQ